MIKMSSQVTISPYHQTDYQVGNQADAEEPPQPGKDFAASIFWSFLIDNQWSHARTEGD